MSTVQQWGRKESIIWPPQGYVYSAALTRRLGTRWSIKTGHKGHHRL